MKISQDYELRLLNENDIDDYYNQNFLPLESELVRQTGSKSDFTFDEVSQMIKRTISDSTVYHYILVSNDGEIVAEAVLSELDENLKSAHFTIAIFRKELREIGLGKLITLKMLKIAFDDLGLHRLELEVYSFNSRAIRFYESLGFYHEGRLRDAIMIDGVYADVVIMSMLGPDYNHSEYHLI